MFQTEFFLFLSAYILVGLMSFHHSYNVPIWYNGIIFWYVLGAFGELLKRCLDLVLHDFALFM